MGDRGGLERSQSVRPKLPPMELGRGSGREILVATNISLPHPSESNERSKTTMTTSHNQPPAPTTWNIDPAHSAAEFKVKHMMISNVKGKFSGLSGVLKLDEDRLHPFHVEASIPVATLNTGDDQRDGHLKSADFFDAEKFPAMTFKSTKVSPQAAATRGDRRPDHPRRDQARDLCKWKTSASRQGPLGQLRIGLSATTKINRKDFGLTWNAALETGGVLVGEEVTITLDVEFIKPDVNSGSGQWNRAAAGCTCSKRWSGTSPQVSLLQRISHARASNQLYARGGQPCRFVQ